MTGQVNLESASLQCYIDTHNRQLTSFTANSDDCLTPKKEIEAILDAEHEAHIIEKISSHEADLLEIYAEVYSVLKETEPAELPDSIV